MGPSLIMNLFIKATATISILALSSVSAWAQRGGGTAVLTAFVEEAVVSDTTVIPGAMIASAPMVVSALRGGEVTMEELQIGSFIRKGTLIGQQDNDDLVYDLQLLELQLADASERLVELKANTKFDEKLLDVAKGQLALLQQKEERARTLLAKKALSQEAAETAKSAVLNAEQQVINREQAVQRAKASQGELERNLQRLALQIKRLKDTMADAQYRAPENGLILSMPAYQQGFARQGDRLIEIQGFDGFEVEAEIPSNYLGFARSADTITAMTGQGQELSLKFRTALPTENRRTATRPARFTIEGDLPRSLYADGARVDVSVPIRAAEAALLVPQDAIVPVAGGHIVFVFDEGKAVRQIVRLGGAVGDKVIVQTGLQAGEKVIIKGNEGLADGAAVKEGAPPKRSVPSGETAEAAIEEAPVVIETELAEDAVEWLLAWSTPRGDSEATLTLSSKANLYEGDPIAVTREGNKIIFDAERVLPFGILTFSFDGEITGENMAGNLTLSGLPNGRTPSFEFTGSVK